MYLWSPTEYESRGLYSALNPDKDISEAGEIETEIRASHCGGKHK